MINRRVACSLILVLIAVFASHSWAADQEGTKVFSAQPQVLTVAVGKSIIVESAESIKRVSVAAPEIADTVPLPPRQVYVTGKTPGVTSLTVWSASGRISAIYDVEVVPDVARLKEKIHQMFPQEENLRVTATHESISLSGTISSAAGMAQVVRLAEVYAPLDREGKPKVQNILEVSGVQQVMLEVRVAEMSRSLLRRIGVNFNYVSANGSNMGISLLNNLTKLPSEGWPGNPLTVSDNINYITQFVADGATWTMLIDALKENGLTKILAEPTLVTLSGKQASFLAGGEYPIPVPQSSSGGGTTITIDYKTFGVGLNFTPTVLSDRKISMQVNPEVSDLDFTKVVQLQGYVIPSLNTRRVSTTIELADGQSFAVAGLLKEDIREVVQKFPVLGDIPILGVLFRSSSFQKNETELVIIVTPHLVKPLNMAKQSLPTDQYIEPDDFEFYLLGSMEGRDKGNPLPPGSPSSVLKKGAGLEGEFGHIKP